MIDSTTSKGRIVAAALKLAAERPWSEVSLLDIAEAAGTNLVDLRKDFASKTAILSAFIRAVDDGVMAKAVRPLPGTAPRDAIFDVVMSRFDVLQPYKAGLKSILLHLGYDSELARRMLASQAWMLNAAGVPLNGISGTVRVLGLGSVYASVFRTWLDDEDPGLARTMAALDRRLRRGEQSLSTFDGVCDTLGGVINSVFRPTAKTRPNPTEEAPSI